MTLRLWLRLASRLAGREDADFYASREASLEPQARVQRWKCQHLIIVICVMAIAFGLRIYYFLNSSVYPDTDPFRHLTLIRNIQLGYGYTMDRVQPFILYPPAWYYVAGMVPDARILSILFSSLTGGIIYFIGKRLYGWKIGVLAGLFWSSQLDLVRFTTNYSSEAMALFLLCLAFLMLLKGNQLTAGILFGMMLVTKQSFIFAGLGFFPFIRWKKAYLFFIPAMVPTLLFGYYVWETISSYPYIMYFDRQIIKSSTFTLVNIFFPYSHPEVIASAIEYPPIPRWWLEKHFLIMVVISTFAIIAGMRWKLALWISPGLIFNIVNKFSSDMRLVIYVLPAIFIVIPSFFAEIKKYHIGLIFVIIILIGGIYTQSWNLTLLSKDHHAFDPIDVEDLPAKKLMIGRGYAGLNFPLILQYFNPELELYGLPYYAKDIPEAMDYYDVKYILLFENDGASKEAIRYVQENFKKVSSFEAYGGLTINVYCREESIAH